VPLRLTRMVVGKSRHPAAAVAQVVRGNDWRSGVQLFVATTLHGGLPMMRSWSFSNGNSSLRKSPPDDDWLSGLIRTFGRPRAKAGEAVSANPFLEFVEVLWVGVLQEAR